ncbi:hypothetical protein GQ44DRAFT_696373 [Phaeosphaeriaceae sp. PMI808]|nr:hypothetical protein GQ44DRAFT_696373 [Phaeosphaeriaceae sp. PMI808]
MFSVPDSKEREEWSSHKYLMHAKLYPFTGPVPLGFLRLLTAVVSEFQTQEIADRLFGCLGLLEGLNYTPNYGISVKQSFTSFAVVIARDYGSLDFLSLWAANLDMLLPNTPAVLKDFPSWVPSWTPIPLHTPWRLATGGTNQYRCDILWNAAGGRKHIHDQVEDAATTERLHVRGRVIDYIHAVSSARFTNYFDGVDEDYLTSLTDQIKEDISGTENWTHIDLIHFLNIITANGGDATRSAEELLGLATHPEDMHSFKDMSGWNDGLGLALVMGRGRRVVRTEKGKLGLVPAIGSQAGSAEKKGSAIVVLHGCIVPVVLELVDEAKGRWKLLGDCYVEGVMCGEAITWKEDDTNVFILV